MTGQDIAVYVISQQRELDELRALVAAQTEREQDIARRMYRRGYLTGRSAARRGQAAVTNPERHARGEARQLTGGAA